MCEIADLYYRNVVVANGSVSEITLTDCAYPKPPGKFLILKSASTRDLLKLL